MAVRRRYPATRQHVPNGDFNYLTRRETRALGLDEEYARHQARLKADRTRRDEEQRPAPPRTDRIE